MPNFTVTVSGAVTVAIWEDSAVGPKPQRLNASPANPHRYYRLEQDNGPVTITATVDGVSAPLDATLSGETFSTSFVEVPVWPAPPISSPAGQSSVASFIPTTLGLHLVMMRRVNGGAVGLHFYVIAPA